MDTHIRALGRLNIAFGVLSAIFFLGTLISYGSLQSLYSAAQADFTAAALLASVLFHAAVAVPCIVLGYAAMQYREWARSALTVVSALNLMNPPIGPFIGAYSLWVLLTPETDPLFTEAPRNRRRPKRSNPKTSLPEEPARPGVKGTSVLRSREADAGPQ
jgi:hypothetical protein